MDWDIIGMYKFAKNKKLRKNCGLTRKTKTKRKKKNERETNDYEFYTNSGIKCEI